MTQASSLAPSPTSTRSNSAGRREPLRRRVARQRYAVEVLLRRVLRRRQEVHPAALLVHVLHPDGVALAGGDPADGVAVAGDEVEVPPPVAVAQPGERAAAL